MNKVLLTGRLTRDPEMRSLASGKNVTTFTVASNEFIGGGQEKAEYHARGHVGPPRRDRRHATSARASRSPSRAGSRPGPGTTTAARATGRPRSSPRTSRCCRAGARRTTRPSRPPTRSSAQAERVRRGAADRADPESAAAVAVDADGADDDDEEAEGAAAA